jgi:hypothetical protein
MKSSVFFLIAGCMLITISCTKDFSNTDSEFPNRVGYEWTYLLQSDNEEATMQVRVVGEGTLPNGVHAKIWKYTYQFPTSTFIDTVWVCNLNQDIILYDKPCPTCTNPMPNERMRYVLPLQTGNTWSTDAAYGDTTKVLNVLNLTVQSGSFSEVYQISHTKGYVTNSWTKDTLYFKERVGLIKFVQEEYNLGPIIGNGTWELTYYNFGRHK